MEQRTLCAIDPRWVGVVEHLEAGHSRVWLDATPAMAADERGLVHGGFAFGLADYAAMVAVNDPNVVLGAAQTRFTAPVVVGQRMRAEARVEPGEGRKKTVSVVVRVDDTTVLDGTFTTFVLDRHVLDSR